MFGNLCLGGCDLRQDDKRHYCTVAGGESEQCGPGDDTTPLGDQCRDLCSKRNDDYYWCQRHAAPWDYCSPQLVFQQHLTCPQDSPRMTTPDPSSCPRYLSCEAGHIRLEECPQGLHYIHKNRTCEWPVEDRQCSQVFTTTRSDTTTTTTSTTTTTTLTFSPTDPVFRVPQDYLDEDEDVDYDDYFKPVRFPDSSDNNQPNIEPRVNPNKYDSLTSTTTTTTSPQLSTSTQVKEKNSSITRNPFGDGPTEDSLRSGITSSEYQDSSLHLHELFMFLATEKPVSSAEDQVEEMDIEEVIEQSKDFKCKRTI